MTPLEKFLHDVHEIHSSQAAVDETPYYGSIETLINEIGKPLNPRVRCIIHPKDVGAGLPDGGLFSSEQFEKKSGNELKQGQLPSRGAIEVKAPKDSASQIALSNQVTRYLARYRQVLVTNLRQFVLVGHDAEGRPVILEPYTLAEKESDFWKLAAHPRKTDEVHGTRLTEYLKRVMLHASPLAAPEDVAFFLASYARDALARIEGVELDAIAAVRGALEEALGLKFEGKKGEHFFRSSLVQTLFYGVFSAWVLWARKNAATSKERFDWNSTARLLKVPVIRKLFHELADPGQLEALKLDEVLDWAAAVLNRVDRPQFFANFEETHAVQYFYEPFLEAFDPDLRKELGVWYTPHEIVQYMVSRVDTVLRQELGVTDGLADKNVYVLDPCCGTGSFLIEVLRHIHSTLKQRGDDALIAGDLRDAARDRVFGFEILPAPFVVSHLQIGLLLDHLGAPLSEKGKDRVGVFLTNALTGWEPPKGPKERLIFNELEEERDAAEHVKRETPIIVVLGNPPYNGFAGVAVKEERALTQAYKTTKSAAAPQGQGLNDLYIRFYRMAERRIADMSGHGVVCLISNYSWLDGLSFTGMRESYLEKFDGIWIDCLNGDKFKTGKLTPDGKPDPSVFSTEWNREGIQVGTAIGLFVRADNHVQTNSVHFKNFWGTTKRTELLHSLADPDYESVCPALKLGLPFLPTKAQTSYTSWPLLTDILPVSFPGVQTSRDELLVDVSREKLLARMKKYFDADTTHEQMRVICPSSMKDTARFKAETTRDYLRGRGMLAEKVVNHLYRPFDTRWLYWEPETKLLDEKRAEYVEQVSPENLWLAAAQKNRRAFDPPVVTSMLSSRHVVERGANLFPLYITRTRSLLDPDQGSNRPNLTAEAQAYLAAIGASERDLFHHAVATLYAPTYRAENSGALLQNWPRLPLPRSKDALHHSANLGNRVRCLLEPQCTVRGVTSGDIGSGLKGIGPAKLVSGKKLSDLNLKLAVGWGHVGKGGAIMPGRGKSVQREYSEAERSGIAAGCAHLSLSADQAFDALGADTYDVYLNDVTYWSNVPARVWEYTIGGYQAIKKWLSYREFKILGRPLTNEEVRYLQEMARRIAAILLLEPALDASYRAVTANVYSLKG